MRRSCTALSTRFMPEGMELVRESWSSLRPGTIAGEGGSGGGALGCGSPFIPRIYLTYQPSHVAAVTAAY